MGFSPTELGRCHQQAALTASSGWVRPYPQPSWTSLAAGDSDRPPPQQPTARPTPVVSQRLPPRSSCCQKVFRDLFRKAHEAFAPLLGFMLRLRRCRSVRQPPLSAPEGAELSAQAEEAPPALLARVGLERRAPSPVLTWSPTGFSLLALPGPQALGTRLVSRELARGKGHPGC